MIELGRRPRSRSPRHYNNAQCSSCKCERAGEKYYPHNVIANLNTLTRKMVDATGRKCMVEVIINTLQEKIASLISDEPDRETEFDMRSVTRKFREWNYDIGRFQKKKEALEKECESAKRELADAHNALSDGLKFWIDSKDTVISMFHAKLYKNWGWCAYRYEIDPHLSREQREEVHTEICLHFGIIE
ncbi:uncharacterized protein LOC126688084 [Mercurialis annua]|uniref:uncharacterized protein LOC126688084 n=1 Tax=Mercurialis annua TaxID=3986 RepID=UPI00215F7038|nr:uncharacterized protein LOC126688084 [Mercurialis annua]